MDPEAPRRGVGSGAGGHERGARQHAGAGTTVPLPCTPAKVLQWMESIGRGMAEAEWVLRPGAAHGADSAFERGCDRVGGDKRIDLPKAGFRGSRTDGAQVLVGGGAWARALDRRHHPAWDRLDGYVKLLMARNTHRGGEGTGQAYRLGRAYGFPVVDLARGGQLDPHAPALVRRLVEREGGRPG